MGLCLGILIISLYSEFIFGNDLYIFRDIGSDTYFQYWPFDRLLGEMLHHGNPMNWTFQVGLGKQISPVIAHLNPFRLLVHLMPPEAAVKAYIYKTLLEIISASLLWSLYMKKLGVSGLANIVFTFIYGFNGYLILWGQHINFGIVFSLIPLTLYSLELLLNERKKWPLIISLAFFMCISIYFFVMSTIFLALFGACRMINSAGTGGGIGKNLVALMVCGLIAVLLSAWFILPKTIFFLESPRIGKVMDVGLFDLFGWMHYVSLLRFFSNNIFGVGNHYYGPINYYEAPQLYCGLLTLLLLPQFFCHASLRERITYGITLAIIVSTLFSPYMTHLFNARFTSNNRYTYVVIIFFIFLAANALHRIDRKRTINTPVFVFTWMALFSIILTVIIAAIQMKIGVIEFSDKILLDMARQARGVPPQTTIDAYRGLFLYRFLPNLLDESLKIIFFLLAYGAVFFWLANKRSADLRILILIVLAELVVFSYPTVNKRANLETTYLEDNKGYYDNTMAAVDFLKGLDEGFFRIAKTYQSVFLNDAAFQGYFGTKGYSSFNEPSTIRFYRKMDIPFHQNRKSPNYIGGFDKRPLLNDLVGVKYMFAKQPLEQRDLVHLNTVGDIHIYRNESALPLGFVYYDLIDPQWFERLSAAKKDRAFFWGALSPATGGESIGDTPRVAPKRFSDMRRLDKVYKVSLTDGDLTKKIERIKKRAVRIDDFSQEHLSGQFTADRDGLLFFSIPYNRGWRASIDGREAETLPVNHGFIGVPVSAGKGRIELVFMPVGQKLGAYLSIGTLGLLILYRLQARKKAAVTVKRARAAE
jgi:uncharacterized membrane protein YfhO